MTETEVFIAEFQAISELTGHERASALNEVARLPMLAIYMMANCVVGEICREAYRATRASAEQQSWVSGKANHTAIAGAIGIDPKEKYAAFALAVFRLIMIDGRAWIAAAIGAPRYLPSSNEREWIVSDIHEIIAWNPKLNETIVFGEAKGQARIVNATDNDPLKIYSDGRSFFQDWAVARAQLVERWSVNLKNNWHIPITEPWHNCVPGALVVGKLSKIRLPHVKLLVAGGGINRDDLSKAVRNQFQIPKVTV